MFVNDPAQIALFIQKVSGWGALFLLLVLVLLWRFSQKKILTVLILVLTVFSALVHIAAYVFFVYKIKGLFDPFYPFTDLCLLCKNVIYPEYFVNFGRIAFWIIGFSLIGLLGRWRKLWMFYLYLLAFLFAALHAWFLWR